MMMVGWTDHFAAAQDEEQKGRGWLGVAIQDITSALRKSMDLKARDGAFVCDVERKSPAAEAGIKEGDVILQFGSAKIEDTSDLQRAVRRTKPGTKVDVLVEREGETMTIQVTVGKAPRSRSLAFVAPRAGRIEIFTHGSLQGLRLRELNEQLAEYFGAPDKKGVLVEEVEGGSAAEKAGFKAGDVILAVGKKRIGKVRDVARALRAYDEGEKVECEVLRNGSRQTLSLEVEEDDGWGYHYRYGVPCIPRFDWYHFNHLPSFGISTPHWDLEDLGVRGDEIRLELDRMKDELREQSRKLREEIEREVKPRIQLRRETRI
jgi:C-terminal processing protease CtpA/Prc